MGPTQSLATSVSGAREAECPRGCVLRESAGQREWNPDVTKTNDPGGERQMGHLRGQLVTTVTAQLKWPVGLGGTSAGGALSFPGVHRAGRGQQVKGWSTRNLFGEPVAQRGHYPAPVQSLLARVTLEGEATSGPQ